MNKTENKTEGLTLYTLQSNYSGDTTKNCGLTGGEIDANFLFLRGNDIYSGEINEENNTLILKKGNENIITIPNIRKDIRITGGYINNATGELVLETNGDDIIITGFTSSLIFTDTTLNGNGSANNPLRLSELYKSSYLPSVKTVVDLTNNEIIQEEYKTTGTYIITKEYNNSDGLLYNFNGVKEIESKLKEDDSNWRVPTFEDWGQMLNALEICDDRNHLSKESGIYGRFAGAYLKNDGLGWIEKTETSYSYGFKANACGFKTSLKGSLLSYGENAVFWTDTLDNEGEVWVRNLSYDDSKVLSHTVRKEGFYSLRLVKDYENVDLVNEKILENNYDIIKMPYVIVDAENNVTQRGYRIWTSVNINFSGISESNYTEVNNNTETKTPLFYLNYWNGNNWVKRLIVENNIITIEDREGKEYKLVNNELVIYKQDVINDLNAIRNNANKAATALQPDNLKKINNLSLYKTSNDNSDINLNDIYYTKDEVDELISGITSGNNKLPGYYTSEEVDNLITITSAQTVSLLNGEIEKLKSELDYLKSIISHMLDVSLTKENGENMSDEEVSRLDTVIKNIVSGEGGEISVGSKSKTTFYIDLNPETMGELIDIK